MSAVPLFTKSQIQIGEIVAVLLVFSTLLIFGLYWYSTTAQTSTAAQLSELERLELTEIGKAVMNLPELQCSQAGRTDSICVDSLRVQALREATQEGLVDDYYRDAFLTNTRASYRLTLINLSSGDETPIFDYTTNDASASTQSLAIPTIYYNPVTEQKTFSILQLTQEVTR